MAWSNSKIFTQWVNGPMFQASGTNYTGLDSDTVKTALFNNSVTPDQDAAVANTGFNTGTWVTANEVTDVTNRLAWARRELRKAVFGVLGELTSSEAELQEEARALLRQP